jgi:hypothetical protein
MKIFASGSCRLLHALSKNSNKNIEIIHDVEEGNDYKGTNFLGKFHDTKCHIQFIHFLQEKITMNDESLKKFFTAYNIEKWRKLGSYLPDSCENPKIINTLKKNIDSCDVYIFEICSLKLYKLGDCYCSSEQLDEEEKKKGEIMIQDEENLLFDLYYLTFLFPNKKIIFQCHFRPNIIYNEREKSIQNRELIYETLKKFCDNKNTFLYDPSELIKFDNNLFDGDIHFTSKGLHESFNHICNVYLNNWI